MNVAHPGIDDRFDVGPNGNWAILRYLVGSGGAYALSNCNCLLELEHVQARHKWTQRLSAGVPVFFEIDHHVTVLVYYDT
jgi:ATP-dependent protease HslVU (ClpYQ) peptidase subunit